MALAPAPDRLQGRPSAHNDYMAGVLRDELMPVQSWLIKKLPLVRLLTRRALEHPKFGVPGESACSPLGCMTPATHACCVLLVTPHPELPT